MAMRTIDLGYQIASTPWDDDLSTETRLLGSKIGQRRALSEMVTGISDMSADWHNDRGIIGSYIDKWPHGPAIARPAGRVVPKLSGAGTDSEDDEADI